MFIIYIYKMNKAYIKKLHLIAEFQKKLAWANFEAANRSTMFKKELMDCAKQAADRCRETRQAVRDAIANREINQQWLDAGAPGDFWD